MALTTLDSLTQKLQQMKSKQMTEQATQMQNKALKRLQSSFSNTNIKSQALLNAIINPSLLQPLLPLACKWFDSGNIFFISPKHDGVRLISYVPTQHVQNKDKASSTTNQIACSCSSSSSSSTSLVQTSCYTRYGRPLYGVFWLEPQLNLLRHVCGDLFLVLDGQLYIHRGPQKNTKCKNNSQNSKNNQTSNVGTSHKRAKRTSCTQTHQKAQYADCRSTASDHKQQVNGKCNDLFKTGFLAVSSLVHRLRGSAMHSLTTQDVLQYVSTLPSYCVFDVASYSPPSKLMSSAGNKQNGKHKKAAAKQRSNKQQEKHHNYWCEWLGTSLPYAVAVQIQRVWRMALEACKIRNVEELRVMPNVTPFSLRLRTLHFLFTLLQQAYSNNVLHSYFVIHRTGSDDKGTTKSQYTKAKSSVQKSKNKMTQMYMKRIPYNVAHSLDEAQNVFLPKFLDEGYQGAVIRSPMNVYEMKEKGKNVVSQLVSPSYQACCDTNQNSIAHKNRKVAKSQRALKSTIQITIEKNVKVIKNKNSHSFICHNVTSESGDVVDRDSNNKCDALCHAAVQLSRCLPPRSHSVVKLLAFKDTQYAVLRPLLKLPSTNPRSRPLVEIPLTRLHKSKEQHDIKWNTHDRRVRKKQQAQLCAAAAAAASANGKPTSKQPHGSNNKHNWQKFNKANNVGQQHEVNNKVAFYGLQCVAENGRVFNVSLPKMSAEQQEMLLTHLLQTSKRKRKAVNGNASKAKRDQLITSTAQTLPLTGLYVTVKYSTLTQHGIPRFASVKAIRGGKGWFM